MPDEIAMVDITATCHTDGCGNAGHAIGLSVIDQPGGPSVTCGVCGQPITDLAEAGSPDDDADQGAVSPTDEGNTA